MMHSVNADAVDSELTPRVDIISEEPAHDTAQGHHSVKPEPESTSQRETIGATIFPEVDSLANGVEMSQTTNLAPDFDNSGLNFTGQSTLTSQVDRVDPSPRSLQHIHSVHNVAENNGEELEKAMLDHTGGATNSTSQSVKPKVREAEHSYDMQLLPPTAFMVKKDGTPILEGSSVLPGVFRTESALQEGTATICANHFNVETSPGRSREQTLLSPSVFLDGNLKKSSTGNDGVAEKSAESHFLSPADEMVYIRNRLLAFKQLKNKCRFVVLLYILVILRESSLLSISSFSINIWSIKIQNALKLDINVAP